jgi:lantibiotic modifying enzyme
MYVISWRFCCWGCRGCWSCWRYSPQIWDPKFFSTLKTVDKKTFSVKKQVDQEQSKMVKLNEDLDRSRLVLNEVFSTDSFVVKQDDDKNITLVKYYGSLSDHLDKIRLVIEDAIEDIGKENIENLNQMQDTCSR